LSEIEKEWAGILRDVRATLLALPSRAARRLEHLTLEDVKPFGSEAPAALEELVSYV